MLQVLSFVAMEPPASFAAEAVRDERGKALMSCRPLRPSDVVRGQYAVGHAEGQPAKGYREESGVAPDSDVETYIAARLHIDNWRWADTPFYLRTGKRLPKRVTEVAIQFKRVPHLPFSYAAAEQLEPNVLVLRIQPNEGISLRFGAKVPSERIADPHGQHGLPVRHRVLRARRPRPTRPCCSTRCAATAPTSPGRTRWRSRGGSWSRVLEAWKAQGGGPHPYEAGTWGPEAADELVARDRRRWRRP